MDVRLQYETGDWRLAALIDTGSPLTVFDRGAAEAIGVRLGRTGADIGHIRMMGGSWRAQFEIIDLSLVADLEHYWSARVAFVTDPSFAMPYQGVLGSEGFLDRFVVTFDQYDGYFLIERPDDWQERLGRLLDQEDSTAAADPQWQRPTSQ